MPVKDNHPTLRRKIACLFAGPALFEPALRAAHTREKGHGRLEGRRLLATADVPAGYLDFPHVRQVFCLTRTTRRGDQEHTEAVYGMTSLAPEQAGPARLLSLARGHWHIESRSHHVRDVTFDEDRSQVRTGSLPQVLAAIRNACIGLMRAAGHKNIAAACRLHAARPRTALALLGIPRTE